jgi:hypothetical protein
LPVRAAPHRLGRPGRLGRLVAASLLVFAASAGLLRAADPLLGEAWESPILQGLQEQEQARKGGRTPEAILQDAKAKATRRGDAATMVARKVLLARAYGLTKDHASARQVYAEVLREAPRCYFAWQHLAMLDLERSPPDRASAEANLRRALAIHPGHLTSARKLTRLLLDADRDAEALPLLRRIVDGEPADLEARKLLVSALGRLKRIPEARAELATLRRRDPKNPEYRDLEAELVYLEGDPARARDLYRALAQEYPSSPQPFAGWLRCLSALARAGGAPAALAEEFERALEGLIRLTRDPEQKRRLQADLDRIRAAAAAKDRPAGPPTDEEVVAVMQAPAVDARTNALRYVLGQPKAPSGPVLRAVLQRLSPGAEPQPSVRVWALRIVGRFGGWGLAGLVRHSLADPDPTVRTTAVSALSLLAAQHPAAAACAVLVLAPLASSPDAALASAARVTAADLARADIPESATTEAARRDAFLQWWAGPIGREAKIESLLRFKELKDRSPEQVLLPYLRDPDVQVFSAAYRALLAEADRSAAGGPGTAASPTGRRAAWWAQFPRWSPEQVGEAHRATVAARVESWYAARPAS